MNEILLIFKLLFLMGAIFYTFAWVIQLVFAHAKINKGLATNVSVMQSLMPAVLWTGFYIFQFCI